MKLLIALSLLVSLNSSGQSVFRVPAIPLSKIEKWDGKPLEYEGTPRFGIYATDSIAKDSWSLMWPGSTNVINERPKHVEMSVGGQHFQWNYEKSIWQPKSDTLVIDPAKYKFIKLGDRVYSIQVYLRMEDTDRQFDIRELLKNN